MKRLIALASAGLLLAASITAGCATNAHQGLQKAEIAAELLYQATATSLDGLEASGKIGQQAHDADKLAAWRALQDVRTQYNLGLAIDLTILEAKAAAAGVSPAVIQGVH